MRAILRTLIITICFFSSTIAVFAQKYWVGAVDGNWSNSSNWSTISGGGGGAGVPTLNEVAIFNSAFNTNCDIASSINAAGVEIRMEAGYTGTLTQKSGSSISVLKLTIAGGTFQGGNQGITLAATTNAFTLSGGTFNNTSGTLTTTTYSQTSGVFNGGSGSISITLNYTLSGGSFTSTSGQLSFSGSSFTSNGGSFLHNGGRVLFSRSAGLATTVSGSSTFNFYDLELSATSHRSVNINNTIDVSNNLTISGTNNLTLSGGTINLYKDLKCTNTGTGGGGTTSINMVGAFQTIDGASAATRCKLPKLTLASSNSLTLNNFITVTDNFTNSITTPGVLSTGTSTVVFSNGPGVSTYEIKGSTTFTNLSVSPSAKITMEFDPLSTFTVSGLFRYEGSGQAVFSGGTIALEGGLTITNTYAPTPQIPSAPVGNTVLAFKGSGNQVITRTTQNTTAALLPAITIEKSGGYLRLPRNLNVSGNWTYVSGTVDYSTNSSTVAFLYNDIIIKGNHTLYNVVLRSSNTANYFTITNSDKLNINGTLVLEGYNGIAVNGDTISVAGNVKMTNNFNETVNGGTATIKLVGGATQELSVEDQTSGANLSPGYGKLPNILIAKSGSAQLNLKGNITLGNAVKWTYKSGTVAPGTSTLYILNGGTVISGSHTLNNLTFNPSVPAPAVHTYTIQSGTKLTLTGDLTIDGTGGATSISTNIRLEGGEMLLNKNISVTNKGTGTGGTTLLTVQGTSDQYLTGCGFPSQGALPKLKLDKATGTLIISQSATVENELIMLHGAINLNSKSLTLGNSASNIGVLTYTDGQMYGGSFSRWYNTSSVQDNVAASLYPMGSSTSPYPIYISTTSNPTNAGTIAVNHDARTGTISRNFDDAGASIINISNAKWDITTNNNLAGGTYKVRINPGDLIVSSEPSNLRVVWPNSAKGTHGTVDILSPGRYSLTRLGLKVGDFGSSASFRIGSNEWIDPLPVEMVSFEAKKVADHVNLTWKTASEKNNDLFVVERSANGRDFTEIARVKGAGTTVTVQNYAYTDNAPLNGTAYYRLVQTDFDGTKNLSKIVQVTFENGMATALQVYPNPATETLNVKLNGVAQTATLQIFDMAGKEVLNRQLQAGEVPGLNVSSFPKGIYQVRTTSGSEAFVSKFVKQ